MTFGSSKYGFETQLDRERREQMEQWKARAAEATEQADQLEAEYLSKELDPIIQDILADLLSAVEKTDSTITWDGKTTWRVGDAYSPGDEYWYIKITLQVGKDGLHFFLESDEHVPGVTYAHERESKMEASIGILERVLHEITGLSVMSRTRASSGCYSRPD